MCMEAPYNKFNNGFYCPKMSRVLHVFITQESYAFQNRQILKFAIYTLLFTTFDPHYQLGFFIFHLQLNSTAVIWHLFFCLRFLLISTAIWPLLRLTNLVHLVVVIWPFFFFFIYIMAAPVKFFFHTAQKVNCSTTHRGRKLQHSTQ